MCAKSLEFGRHDITPGMFAPVMSSYLTDIHQSRMINHPNAYYGRLLSCVVNSIAERYVPSSTCLAVRSEHCIPNSICLALLA